MRIFLPRLLFGGYIVDKDPSIYGPILWSISSKWIGAAMQYILSMLFLCIEFLVLGLTIDSGVTISIYFFLRRLSNVFNSSAQQIYNKTADWLLACLPAIKPFDAVIFIGTTLCCCCLLLLCLFVDCCVVFVRRTHCCQWRASYYYLTRQSKPPTTTL